jgi:hypothetical protein
MRLWHNAGAAGSRGATEWIRSSQTINSLTVRLLHIFSAAHLCSPPRGESIGEAPPKLARLSGTPNGHREDARQLTVSRRAAGGGISLFLIPTHRIAIFSHSRKRRVRQAHGEPVDAVKSRVQLSQSHHRGVRTGFVNADRNPHFFGGAEKSGTRFAVASAAPHHRTLGGQRRLASEPCQGRQPPKAGPWAAFTGLTGQPHSASRGDGLATATPCYAAKKVRICTGGNRFHR